MSVRVEAIGPKDAKIMLIGEAPGEQEEKAGIPFVGTAGRILDGILEEVGLPRESCYITNVYKYRPEGNDFSKIAQEDLAKAYGELIEEIMLVRPNVIVLLGNEPMRAILGYVGVQDWRGSVIETRFGKCIPTIHPAAIGREWMWRPIVVHDMLLTKKESEYPEVRRMERKLLIHPSLYQIMYSIESIKSSKCLFAFDIEVETKQISCISLSPSVEYSISIPFWFGASGSMWSPEDELKIWTALKEILEDPTIPKVAQNAQYDMTILNDIYGIKVQGLVLDTMIAFHVVYPELPKRLSLISSLCTDVPFYKNLRTTEDMDTFFKYNATDACVTYECAIRLMQEMKEFGVEKFYIEHMHSLIEPLMAMSRRGVKINSQLKKEAILEYKARISALESKLNGEVGHVINVYSPKQMQKWLYDELKLPKKYKLRKAKGESTVSTDEDTLEELYHATKIEALKTVLDIREARKILSTYLETEYDHDKLPDGTTEERARTAYLITGTETGRLSSRETVYGTGTNLQNVPKGITRRIFIPDTGKVFVNADLSQAEARVVAYLAGEDRLIKVFESGGDIHRKNAANIFRKREEDVTKEERELAKRIVHASNYGMGPVTFAKNVGITVAEAKKLLNAYFAEYPRIKLWQMSISAQLRKTRMLTTPLGRKRTFFNRWDSSLQKEAYAYIPQSTVADVLNAGLRRFYQLTKDTDTELLLQIHDAVLVQTPKEELQKTMEMLAMALRVPVMINHREVVIPVDISVGSNWDKLRKV